MKTIKIYDIKGLSKNGYVELNERQITTIKGRIKELLSEMSVMAKLE